MPTFGCAVVSPLICLQKTRIQVWLYEQAHMRIEGKIIVRLAGPARRLASVILCALCSPSHAAVSKCPLA